MDKELIVITTGFLLFMSLLIGPAVYIEQARNKAIVECIKAGNSPLDCKAAL